MTVVDLSHVAAAAHTDPGASQGHVTYKGDVLPVEQALAKLNFLNKAYVDGSYGTLTLDAYRRLQGSLGYTGADADGIPGFTSLTKLGHASGLFTVTPGSTPHPTTGGTTGGGGGAVPRITPISLGSVQFTRVADYSVSKVMAEVCAQAGVTSKYWVSGADTVAARESSYQVNAINNYDLNAHGPIVADGYPEYCSRGTLQFIAPTFASNHHSGTSNNIYDGHALCWAFINYTMTSYGVALDGSNLAARVQQADPNRSPRGY